MTHTPPSAPPETMSPARRPPGHDNVRGGLRFLAEIIAMVAVPWALWPHSILLAIGSVILLIVLIHLTAAVVAVWVIWPWVLATAVTALCVAVIFTEQTRWRTLTRRTR